MRAAIAELGYRPSSTARNLSLGRSQAIGVVAPFFTTPSVVERLRGVSERLASSGYGLMLFDVETPEQRAGAFRDFARLDRVDGLLVISLPLADDEVVALERDHLPIVMVDIGHPRVPHVVIDDVRGGELAAEHLIARGHRRIGFVGRRSRRARSVSRRASTAAEGFRRALPRAGIEPDASSSGAAATGARRPGRWRRACCAGVDRPTAVFAASDTQALGVLEAARRRAARARAISR